MMTLLMTMFRRLGRSVGAVGLKMIVAVIAIVWYSASGYLYFEIEAKPDLTWGDALWWSLVTMTTVGYGDHFPQTLPGRYLVGVPTMVFGISTLGYLLSSVATYLIESKSKELKGMKQLKLEDHVLLVHFSDTHRVLQMVTELQSDHATRGKPIVLIDNDLEELPAELAARDIKFVRGNPARESTLERANYAKASYAIILARDPKDVRSDDLNLAVTITIERLNAKIRTVVECVDPESIEILRRTGCDSIVCASKLCSSLLVQELLDPGVQAVFDELSRIQLGQQIFVSEIGAMQDWTYTELCGWGAKCGMLVLGIKRGNDIHLNPDRELALKRGDQAILIGAHRPAVIDTEGAAR